MSDEQTHQEPNTVISLSVPADPAEPMIGYLRYDGLRFAYLRREALSKLEPSWQAYGVYVLLGVDDSCGPGEYRAYVGQTTTLTSRLSTHRSDRDKDWATHVLIFARAANPEFAFNLAEIGWLEGRIHAMLERAQYARVENRRSTGNSGLDSTARAALENLARPISAVMRALGYPTATPEQDQGLLKRARTRTATYHGVKVVDLINEGLLEVGATLRPTTPLYEGEAEVLQDGALLVQGERFDSPSPAAARITGGTRNGWEFWGAAAGDGSLVSLKELRAQLGDTSETDD
ncbi:MAG UNVERIFIED_CONTAM: hypothetical protein LOD86_08840 [Thermobifida fusca]